MLAPHLRVICVSPVTSNIKQRKNDKWFHVGKYHHVSRGTHKFNNYSCFSQILLLTILLVMSGHLIDRARGQYMFGSMYGPSYYPGYMTSPYYSYYNPYYGGYPYYRWINICRLLIEINNLSLVRKTNGQMKWLFLLPQGTRWGECNCSWTVHKFFSHSRSVCTIASHTLLKHVYLCDPMNTHIA